MRDPVSDSGGKPTTSIATSTADDVFIRGKSLTKELIGQLTFTEMMFFQVLGPRPSAAEPRVVDACLVTLLEHGLTPSALATRLVYTSAPEAMQSAVAAGLLAVGVNALGNWLLIFGHFGLPAWGVFGSGMATFFSQSFMMATLIAYAFIDPVFSSGVYIAMAAAFGAAEAASNALKKPADAQRVMSRFEAEVNRALDRFSWFIYRMNRSPIRDLFMSPRNHCRIQEAILSLLSGEVFGPSPVHQRLALFKGIYYVKSAAEWIGSAKTRISP